MFQSDWNFSELKQFLSKSASRVWTSSASFPLASLLFNFLLPLDIRICFKYSKSIQDSKMLTTVWQTKNMALMGNNWQFYGLIFFTNKSLDWIFIWALFISPLPPPLPVTNLEKLFANLLLRPCFTTTLWQISLVVQNWPIWRVGIIF